MHFIKHIYKIGVKVYLIGGIVSVAGVSVTGRGGGGLLLLLTILLVIMLLLMLLCVVVVGSDGVCGGWQW